MRATNYARATYQEVYDLSTVSGKLSIIGIHTPTGTTPRQMLSGFFNQFSKFRYTGCNVTMIPAAQLPADPLQVSYEAGETIDPRDLLNPILFHGCHGQDLSSILNTIYADQGHIHTGSSAEVTELNFDETTTLGLANVEGMYYAGLSDPTFRKFNVQTGVKLNGLHPLVHSLATTLPVLAGAGDIAPRIEENGSMAGMGNYAAIANENWSGNFATEAAYLANRLQTVRMERLGWLPTTRMNGTDPTNLATLTSVPVQLPRIFMGVLILPPSYKQELYFRMVITHNFEFKDFSSCLNKAALSAFAPNGDYVNWLPDSAVASETSLEAINANVELTTAGVF